MHIMLNDRLFELNSAITISQLFDHLKLNASGIAIAINQIIAK